MRRYNPEYNPLVVPSNLNAGTFKIVCFRVENESIHIPPYLLLATPSIFWDFKDDLGGLGMKAVMDSVKITAASTKAFDVVFQPLLYGYLDMEEIDRKNTFEHQPFALLVDGLILADKIKANSVVKLIQEELRHAYGWAGVSIQAISKLFQGLPMTQDFLVRYLSRAGSTTKGVKILEEARRTITGFITFERIHVLEGVGGARIKTEQGPTVKNDAKEVKDVSVGAGEGAERTFPMAVLGNQGKRSAEEISPIICESKHLKDEETQADPAKNTAAHHQPPSPAQHLSEVPSTSTRLLQDLDTVASDAIVEIPVATAAVSSQTAKKANAKAPLASRNLIQTRQRARATPITDFPTVKASAVPIPVADVKINLTREPHSKLQVSTVETVASDAASGSGEEIAQHAEGTEIAEQSLKAMKARRITKASKIVKSTPAAKRKPKTAAKPKTAFKSVIARQNKYGSQRRDAVITPRKSRPRRRDDGRTTNALGIQLQLHAEEVARQAAATAVAAAHKVPVGVGDGREVIREAASYPTSIDGTAKDTGGATNGQDKAAQATGTGGIARDGVRKGTAKATGWKGKAAHTGKGASTDIAEGAGPGGRPRRATKNVGKYGAYGAEGG